MVGLPAREGKTGGDQTKNGDWKESPRMAMEHACIAKNGDGAG